MPVFNEEASVARVIDEWVPVLRREAGAFQWLVIDDGSTDATWSRLTEARERHGPCLELVRRGNRGHGASCVEGYRAAVDRRVPWVFQIDSDGQCDPRYFARVWAARHGGEVVYGARRWRDDGIFRMAASWVLKVLLLVGEGVYCADPNTPYRLMRTGAIAAKLDAAARVDLANVALAVLLRRDAAIRQAVVPIRFRKRFGGVSSVKWDRFAASAGKLRSQLRALRRSGAAVP